MPGKRYHVKNLPADRRQYPYGRWVFDEVDLANAQFSYNLLVRVLIGKIEDEKKLARIIKSVPVISNDVNWRCRTWCANVLEALAKDGKALGTAELDWAKIEAAARDYVRTKTAAGRYSREEAEKRLKKRQQALQSQTQGGSSRPAPPPPPEPAPTYDLLARREIFD